MCIAKVLKIRDRGPMEWNTIGFQQFKAIMLNSDTESFTFVCMFVFSSSELPSLGQHSPPVWFSLNQHLQQVTIWNPSDNYISSCHCNIAKSFCALGLSGFGLRSKQSPRIEAQLASYKVTAAKVNSCKLRTQSHTDLVELKATNADTRTFVFSILSVSNKKQNIDFTLLPPWCPSLLLIWQLFWASKLLLPTQDYWKKCKSSQWWLRSPGKETCCQGSVFPAQSPNRRFSCSDHRARLKQTTVERKHRVKYTTHTMCMPMFMYERICMSIHIL